jgi:hypothetical protein
LLQFNTRCPARLASRCQLGHPKGMAPPNGLIRKPEVVELHGGGKNVCVTVRYESRLLASSRDRT